MMAEKRAEDIPVSFKLHETLVEQLDKIAQRDKRTRSATVRIALERYVASQAGDTREKGANA